MKPFFSFLLVLFPSVIAARLGEHHLGSDPHQRRTVEDDPCASLQYPKEDVVSLELTQSFLIDKVLVAMELSDLVNREEYGRIEHLVDDQRQIYERFVGIWDYNDQALVAKTRGGQICFVTFQSTDPGNGLWAFLMDHWQNANPFTSQVGTSDCRVRRGYLNAYNASRYRDDLRRSIDDCVASCEHDDGCPLVLAGFSQGGSAAVVASMDLRHYHPQVITFGSARVVVQDVQWPCTAIDESRHYRFVTTSSEGYDVIPNQRDLYGERHVGHSILLDTQAINFPLAMPGDGSTERRTPTSLDLHGFPLYRKAIEDVVQLGCFPVPVAQWSKGHYCHYGDECSSKSCDPSNHECAG